MRIYIDLEECKDSTGKVIAAMPKLGLEVDVDEGYHIPALCSLKHELQEMLERRIKECIA